MIIPSRYHVGLATVLGAVFLIALAPKLDTDLWWHLKDGAYISAYHAVPTHDYLSFTFAGHAWTDHEWLSDLILYGCYRIAGLWGTIVLFAGVICATFAFVYRRMVALRANRMLALFVLVGAFIASSATWGARPQMVTLLFLAVYALTLERWIVSRDRRFLVIFPSIMILWSNLHGGWVLGVALLAITLLGEWLNCITRHESRLSTGDLKALLLTVVATLAATLLNPAGLRAVLYPLVWIFPSAYSNVLSEWVSSDFHQPVTMVFEAMLLLLTCSVFVARPKLNWTHLLLILAFTHLALSQSRNVAVWAVVVGPLVALYLQQAISSRARIAVHSQQSRRLSPGRERILNTSLLVLTGVLYVVETFHFVNAQALKNDEFAQFPAGAVQYMKRHRLPPNTFSSYAWGGYIVWKLYPRYRDFIDGRANTLFDDRILHAYLTAYTAAPGWTSVLRKYDVQNVLINPGAPLSQALAENHSWRRVYHDQTSTLYTRRK